MGIVQLTPKVLEYFSDVPIVQASCGEAHSLLLDQWGRVFSFGWHQLGQLGVGKLSQGFRIHTVSKIPKISKIYAGAIFSMVLSCDGKLFVWG